MRSIKNSKIKATGIKIWQVKTTSKVSRKNKARTVTTHYLERLML